MAEGDRFEHGSVLGGKILPAGSALSGNQQYDIEKHIYGRSAGDRLYVRRQHSKPKVEAFRSWAEQQLGCISGKSDLAKAFR